MRWSSVLAVIKFVDSGIQTKDKDSDEQLGEDGIAVRLIEDYLEGKITSLIDLSQLLKDEAGLIISKSTLARRLKGKVACLLFSEVWNNFTHSLSFVTSNPGFYSVFQVNVKVRRRRGYQQRRSGIDE